jgi:alpha-D-xyloside xylohydrolase
MKISDPFLLSSGGWGLLIENGCAMRFRGEGYVFTFQLDAAEEISYAVIRAENCAEVLKKLTALIGKPTLLPKWAFGYIQSKERYKSSAELIETAAEFRRRGLGLDCIVLDWCSWRDGCWGDKTPDPERFPDVRKLTDTLHGMNVRLMVSIWPNTAKGQDCDEFLAADAFLPGVRCEPVRVLSGGSGRTEAGADRQAVMRFGLLRRKTGEISRRGLHGNQDDKRDR